MLYQVINKKFTEIVMEYLANGYYINTMSQCGSQGEISKVDVTDGKEIIRIMLESFYCTKYTDKGFGVGLDGIKIIVGKSIDRVIPNDACDYGTIWNDKLEVIREEYFYQVGKTGRCNNKCFGTYDEAVEAQKKQHERWQCRPEAITRVFSQSTYELVLPVVKRQPRCKTAKVSDIEKVYSVEYKGHKKYYVKAKGKEFAIK